MKYKEKSIVLNVIFNVIYKTVNTIFPFLTTMYISHVLLASGVGKVNIAQNIAQYFVLIAPLGITNYGTREIAKLREKQSETNELFSELFSINLFSTIFCSSIYYMMVFCSSYFCTERKLFCIAGLAVVFNSINVEWYYQGYEDFVYIAMRSIFVKCLSFVLILIFIKSTEDYVLYALIYVLGIAGNHIFNLINIIREGVKIRIKFNLPSHHFKPIFLLLCSNIAIELYTLLDTTMLGAMCTEEVVGYYTSSIKLVKTVIILIAAIGSILLPRLSYYIHNRQFDRCEEILSLVCMIYFFIGIPCNIGLFICAKDVISILFGASFAPALTTLRIGSFLIYAITFNNLFGTQVLLAYSQEKKILCATIIGAISNIIMNVVLISKYEQDGAIIASLISEVLVMIVTIVFARKEIKIRVNYFDLMKEIIAASMMLIVVCMIRFSFDSAISRLILSVLLGGFTYLFLNSLLKNSIILWGARKIKSIRMIK